MAEEVHGEEGAGAAAKGGEEQQGGLRRAAACVAGALPLAVFFPMLLACADLAWLGLGVGVLGLPLVVTEGHESKQVDGQQVVYDDCRRHRRRFFWCKSTHFLPLREK